MKKFLLMVVMVLSLGMITGCGSWKMYGTDERSELHDVIGYVADEQLLLSRVIGSSLPTRVSDEISSDYTFVDYVSTMDIDPTKPVIALTFDDGPVNGNTNAILDVLEEYGAKATFYMVGDNVGEGTSETLHRMVSIGCEVANHTQSHAYLDELDVAGIKEQIGSQNEAIYTYSGRYARTIRPPGGYISDLLKQTVNQPLIMWSVDTLDWKTRNVDSTFNVATTQVRDGDIVLMHDIHNETAAAVASIVPELSKMGYQMVTVSELAYLKGVKMQAGEVYYDFCDN